MGRVSWLRIILALLHGHVCWSSVFGFPGDRMSGGNARCIGRRIREGELGVAHRTLPCGSRVALYHPGTGRVVVAPVVDRGPYGATLEDGTWALKRTREEPGRWRGALDLSRATADALGHNGFEKILYAPLEETRKCARGSERSVLSALFGYHCR